MKDDFVKINNENCFVNAKYLCDIENAQLDSVEKVKSFDNFEKLSKANLASFRLRGRFKLNDKTEVYIKKYFKTPVKNQLKNFIAHRSFKTTAEYDMDCCDELSKVKVNTAEIIAYGYEKGLIFEKFSFIIIKAIDNAAALDKVFPKFDNFKQRKDFIIKLADFIQRFHSTSFVHRDLYLCHIFYCCQDRKLTLIDLQRVFKPLLMGLKYRIKDIAQLYYSADKDIAYKTDRLRFYKYYTGINKLRFTDKIIIKLINNKAGKMLRHDIRNNRKAGYAI